MTHTALEVADHYIEYSGYTRTHLELQKLTYISHGFMLSIYDTPLVEDKVEAWRTGPMYPIMHKKFKWWGSSVIGRMSGKPADFSPKEFDLVDEVFKHYGKYDGYYMSQIMQKHPPQITPWEKVYAPNQTRRIPDDLTKEFFLELSA